MFSNDNRESGIIYPDFIGSQSVLDAKYKRLDKGVSREDRFQMISYMHVLKKNFGCLIFPLDRSETLDETVKKLNGYGGEMRTIGFRVPQDQPDAASFLGAMRGAERSFAEKLSRTIPERQTLSSLQMQ